MKKQSVAIVGAGKVGCALAELLHTYGYPLAGIASRTLASAAVPAERFGVPSSACLSDITAKAAIVFITTPDRCIGEVSLHIAKTGGFRQGQYVYHTCGSLTADILQPAKDCGAFTGSMHPLQAFASVEVAMANLPGSFFAIDGDSEAAELAETIVNNIGGHSFFVPPEKRTAYHAAACVASNYLVALVHYASGILGKLDLSQEEAILALLPLLRGTIENLASMGTVKALTGPISRGDAGTVAGHLAILDKLEHEQELYRKLGLYTLQLARENRNLEQAQSRELEKILRV